MYNFGSNFLDLTIKMSNDLYGDAVVQERVNKVWAEVFTASNQVLQHARTYGFLGMEVIPNPNVHQMLVTLQMLDALMDVILLRFEDLPYEEKRLIFNAKEQITRMERVAAALQENNSADFNEAIACLERQAVF